MPPVISIFSSYNFTKTATCPSGFIIYKDESSDKEQLINLSNFEIEVNSLESAEQIIQKECEKIPNSRYLITV